MIKETCVENLSEALRAEEFGADRIELCDNLAVGGTTPSFGTIITCKKHLKIPVMVMIRPRGGNFIYNSMELESMLRDIKVCRDTGADGIVTGAMTPHGTVNMDVLKQLVEEARGLQVTFHKAIDSSRDIPGEIIRLRDSGIHRILSSGGALNAMEGAVMLNEMIQLVSGKLIIIAAGNITESNLVELSRLIHTQEFHGRKITGELTPRV